MVRYSARDQDPAATRRAEEGVGRGGQLHLWAEAGLRPAVRGAGGRHVGEPAPHTRGRAMSQIGFNLSNDQVHAV